MTGDVSNEERLAQRLAACADSLSRAEGDRDRAAFHLEFLQGAVQEQAERARQATADARLMATQLARMETQRDEALASLPALADENRELLADALRRIEEEEEARLAAELETEGWRHSNGALTGAVLDLAASIESASPECIDREALHAWAHGLRQTCERYTPTSEASAAARSNRGSAQ